MKCEIIRDLLPSYIDELTSDESNKEIEKHIKTCNCCKSELDNMKQDIKIEALKINKRDIQPFKKFNKKYMNIFRNISIFSLIVYLITSYYIKLSFDNVYSTRDNLSIELQSISENNDMNNPNLYSNELDKVLNQNYNNILSLDIYTNDLKNPVYTYTNKSNINTITTNISGDILTKTKKSKAHFEVDIDYKPVIVGNIILKYIRLGGVIALIIYVVLLLKYKFRSRL